MGARDPYLPAGKGRVLVVEDRGIVAAKVQRVLSAAGYVVVGLAPTLASALAQLDRFADGLDAALLDIDLRGEPAYPVAAVLRDRGIPFVFLTGYGALAVAEPWQGVPRVEKPFEAAALLRAVADALAGKPADRAPGAAGVATPAIRRAWEAMRHTRDIVTEARAYRELLNPPAPGSLITPAAPVGDPTRRGGSGG